MIGKARSFTALLSAVLTIFVASTAAAQTPPAPAPAPGGPLNVFYGAVPPNGAAAPVVVFVHGLRGMASDWWLGNNMYELTYKAGYGTAFISLSPDNTRNDKGVADNAIVLGGTLPLVAAHYGVPKFYIIAHSKGGIDVQAVAMNAAITPLVKAVFTIGTPHTGTELADWAFGAGKNTAALLGLLTPGVNALRTTNLASFRATADPFYATAGIPFYTMAGDISTPHPLTVITGPILQSLAPGPNDGLIPVAGTKLPSTYSKDLGEMLGNHFYIPQGNLSFSRIHAEMQFLENLPDFRLMASGGFGDRHNSFAWSMKWFKGKLYVGTGRAFLCVTAATSDRTAGTHIYPPLVADVECTPAIEDLPLAAEIWQLTPETNTWARVFVSPQDIPIAWDANQVPTKFTARDIGFRGMASFVEQDGTEALYHIGRLGVGALRQHRPLQRPVDRVSPASTPPFGRRDQLGTSAAGPWHVHG